MVVAWWFWGGCFAGLVGFDDLCWVDIIYYLC